MDARNSTQLRIRRAAARALAVAAVFAACGPAACQSSRRTPPSEKLTASQFSRPGPVAPTEPSQPIAAPPTQDEPPTSTTLVEAQPAVPPPPRPQSPSDTLAIRSYVGEPAVAAPAAPVDEPLVLESVVGQINGRPIFASEILTPLDGILRAKAEELRAEPLAFSAFAKKEIGDELDRKVNDELILGEVRSQFTPEQRQGLVHFMNHIQGRVVSQQSGSRLQADETLREATGRSLHEYSRDRLEQELINEEIKQKVRSRVNIPWRLIRQQYERDYDAYNPPGRATLRAIQVPLANAEAVRQAEESIAAGAFVDAAQMEFNSYLRADGGLMQREVPGRYEDTVFFPDPERNSAARALAPGQTAGPVRVGKDLWWIHLEAVEQPPGTTLYDAQLEIEQRLARSKGEMEATIYLGRLHQRASISAREQMLTETLAVALERYLPSRTR